MDKLCPGANQVPRYILTVTARELSTDHWYRAGTGSASASAKLAVGLYYLKAFFILK